ncbi:MAG: ABC-F family ATP-binding cassette domain-containing protein [Prevotella sp.]|nr:ABC-F family ATP-binding cassette domain-containing protein [Prevotella sp.]MCI6804190.1 ABC-F family ATP-binding cassette domain-containing protein [Prevotella sp.]MDD7067421.1 ABC-F family ATP-binding cassette domain-containing protein [Prevotella sp.]MDD7127320.1 ABC-F family ATP-binding cassette domain-containing protein [Prevotella sp.]MDD7507249.1 ABC-F family ATP-binding cassette domain-containing protein [Prevotella sp.]
MQPLLDIQNVSKRFGERVLFEDISFSIGEGQRVGLIAQNGTGKTTLLSMLTGDESCDSGAIIYRNGIKVGYLRQEPKFPEGASVLEACFHGVDFDDDAQLKAKQILTQLRIKDLNQPIAQLSGGQQKRVALAQALISNPDLLILDEPTNHLDLEMVVWLEGFLSRGNRSLLMVTHDRYFLDNVCSVILELDNKTIYSYKGSYSYYLEKRQQRIDATRANIEHANNLYRRELEWMRRQPQARGHKARYREEAFYELEKVAKQRIEERQIRLKASNVYIGSKIFECQYVSKAFPARDDASSEGKTILKDFYYNFARFEKMGIVGNNGTGKSTFLKLLLGIEPVDSGKFDIGETVKFGYFSQEGLQFDESQKVIDVVRDIADYIDLGQGRHLTASQFLQHFLFSPEQQYNYVYKLSGGEKRKLYLCTVLMRNPNFLVLDEPTNDLDIKTLQILEEYLQDFPGCVIVVSHDRYFMDKVVDHLLVFRGEGEIKDFPGNYTQYREWQKLEDKKSAELKEAAQKATASRNGNNAPTPSPTGKSQRDPNAAPQKRKMTFKEKQEFAQLEKDIEALTAEKESIETALSSGSVSVEQITEMSKRLPILNEELDEKEMRWLELSEI